MGRIVHLVVDIVLSLMGVAGAVWLAWHSLQRSDDPAKLIFKWIFTIVMLWVLLGVAVPLFLKGGLIAMIGLAIAGIWGIAMTVTWRNSIIEFLTSPLTSMYDGGKLPPEPKPYYSIAQSKRKLNKPLEAVVAIREQLAKFPNDFEGIMLLADIQAEDLKDLASAEMTLNHFCEWDKAPQKQVAAALTQLADWHLKFSSDAYSAAGALRRIVEKFPETEMALVAKQRIAHLEGTEKMLLASHDRRQLPVPEGVRNVGLLDSSADLAPQEVPPGELAAAYVKQLEAHPDDTEAREKLAILYVTHFKRLDLATGELAQMIAEPKYPPRRIAHWLNLLADLQVRGGADYETVRATLEQIVERFPDYAVAEVALSRLARLKLEFKGLETTSAKTLGVYEQNIGLKGSRHY